MRNVYLNNIVDISDPDCEFIREFDREIQKYGALVYSHETNAYQFIKKFEQIDYKKELLPDFMKVENSDPLLKALNLTIHYEFDPETEEDEENLEIWQQLSQIDIPVFDYDDDGEIRLASEIKLYPSENKFTVWFLNRDSYEYILDQDLLMIAPVIKNINIARKLIRDYGIHPFENRFDPKDHIGYVDPDLVAILNTGKKSR